MKPNRSATSSGLHFYSLYQCCQRKFFLRFGPPRLEPLFTAPPLLAGGAFHAGKAEFYITQSEKKALALVRSELAYRKPDFENRDDYLSVLDRTPAMLASWITEYGKSDLKSLNILDVEKMIKVPFPGRHSWNFTMRLDMIAEDRFGNTLIFETKTSSWSIKSALIGIELGDQATAYVWGAEHHYKRKVTAVVPDITFLSSNTQDTKRIVNHRGEFVYREPEDFKFFARSFSQVASEMTQKMKAVYAGGDTALFARNSYYCQAYNRPCEFAEICRMNLTAKSKVPNGFRKKPGHFKPSEITTPVEDAIAGG